MADFSKLRSAIESLVEVWDSADWSKAVDDLAKEVKAGCQGDFFEGNCESCVLERDCAMVYEMDNVINTVRWRDAIKCIGLKGADNASL